jgi:hypothetical protein
MESKDCIPCNRNNPIKRIGNILEGYTNLIFKNGEIELLAEERLKECIPCDNKEVLIIVGDKTVYGCKSCKCPIDAKVRAEDEKCPLGKW